MRIKYFFLLMIIFFNFVELIASLTYNLDDVYIVFTNLLILMIYCFLDISDDLKNSSRKKHDD